MRRLLLFILLTVSLARADRVSSILGCTQNLKSIATGLEMYATDHAGNYPKSLKELIPTYIKSIPACPAAGQDTYSPSWRLAGSEGFFMCCSGKHHADFGLQTNQPSLDARHYLGPQSMLARLHALEDQKSGAKPIARCMNNLKNIATALEVWATDHGGRYPKSLKELKQGYLRDLPQCLGKDTYRYQVSTMPDNYTVRCQGTNHIKDGSRANFPYYTSMKGLQRE